MNYKGVCKAAPGFAWVCFILYLKTCAYCPVKNQQMVEQAFFTNVGKKILKHFTDFFSLCVWRCYMQKYTVLKNYALRIFSKVIEKIGSYKKKEGKHHVVRFWKTLDVMFSDFQ